MDKRLILWVLLLVGIIGTAAFGDLNSGLMAHWEFEGNFNDSAGTNHGTAKGDAKIVSDPNRGQVLELDGTGDYIEVPDSPSLSITGSQITLVAWVNVNDAAPIQIAIGKVFNNTSHTTPYFSYSLQALANGQPAIWLRLGTANRRVLGATGSIKAQRWHHLAGIYNGSQMLLYLDGKVVATGNYTGDIPAYNTVLRLGTNGGLTEQMGGKMDDVRIYNRALSEREVLSLATGLSLGTAWNPNPADGAVDWSSTLLTWTAGDNAVFHHVYLGTTEDLTEADKKAGPLPPGQTYYSAELMPATTYYWRVDEVEANQTMHKGLVWSFTTPPAAAYAARPPDGAEYVPPEQVELTWAAGMNAITHDVYFGDDAAAVAAGTGNTFKGNQAANTYNPGALQKNKTYYWRVDEVGLAGTVTGAVWSFSTIPDIAIGNPDLVGWWKCEDGERSTIVDWSGHGNHAAAKGDVKIVMDAERGPVAQFDGTGDYLEAANSPSLNLTGDKVSLAAWVNFDSVATVQMIVCKVFNNATHTTPYFSYGLHTLANGQPRFWISRTGGAANRAGTAGMFKVGTWHHVAGVYDGAQMQLYLDGVLIGSTNVTGNLVGYDTVLRMGINGGLGEPLKGKLDDVRVYSRALTLDDIALVMRGDTTLAWDPSPANGATTDAIKAAALAWQAGDKAAQHDVYFGTNRAAVRGADRSDTTGIYRGRVSTTSYNPSPAVEWGKEYFWRVDEVNTDGTVTKGYVWSFIVADYLIVDDFEEYTNESPFRVFQTWLDGIAFSADDFFPNEYAGNGTGATVGHNIWVEGTPYTDIMEKTIVPPGSTQSMPLYFNNSDAQMKYYSQTQCEGLWDWTVGGLTTLQLQVRGRPAPGSVSYDGATQTYTMTGAGSNVWAAKDEFHFAYKELAGDGSIEVRVDGMSANPPHGDPRVGVMIRDTLDADSANALLFVEPDPRTRLTQRVRAADATTDVAVAAIGTTPTWLRLTRQGYAFKAEKSDNGTTWTPILDTGSEASIFMTDPVYIGLVVCSHAAGQFIEATFSNVKTNGVITPAGPFTTSQDIGIASNSPQPLYVALQDTANRTAMVTRADLVNVGSWTPWNIPLTDFTGVNPAAVKKISIGVGDPKTPTPDGTGLIYIDDIRVIRP